MAREKVRHERQAEGGHEPVDGVGRCRAHAGKEPRPPAEDERAARAQDTDGADRGRDDKTDDESLEKKDRIHAEKVAFILLTRNDFDNRIIRIPIEWIS